MKSHTLFHVPVISLKQGNRIITDQGKVYVVRGAWENESFPKGKREVKMLIQFYDPEANDYSAGKSIKLPLDAKVNLEIRPK